MIRNDIDRSPERLAMIRSLYAHQDRIEPCACGLAVRLEGNRTDLLPVVMARHNKQRAHQDWRARQAEPQPTPRLPSGDLIPAELRLSAGVRA